MDKPGTLPISAYLTPLAVQPLEADDDVLPDDAEEVSEAAEELEEDEEEEEGEEEGEEEEYEESDSGEEARAGGGRR